MHFQRLLFFLFLSPVFSDEDYSQFTGCCIFKGPGLKDAEYIIENRFNDILMMQYNSTKGNWTGFTAYAIEETKHWNGDPYEPIKRALEKKLLCEDNRDHLLNIHNITAAPTVKLKALKHPPVLVCSAFNFYPKQIRVTWFRNGHKVTSGVSVSDLLSDGEWSYQIHSYLRHDPSLGEKIACMVEHYTLSEPAYHTWDPSPAAQEQIQIAVGLCGLMLGFVISSSGFIYYKKKSAAYFSLHQGRMTIPVEQLNAVTELSPVET